jgi:hypothetical protein
MQIKIIVASSFLLGLLSLVDAQTNRCPQNGESATFPNPADSHSFIACENGRPFVQQCPLDLSFDAGSLSCVYIPNYDARPNHAHRN